MLASNMFWKAIKQNWTHQLNAKLFDEVKHLISGSSADLAFYQQKLWNGSESRLFPQAFG